MPDEIDLLRTFREHTPGPSATAWARAQTAIESARLEEGDAPQGIGAAPDQTVGRPRPGRSPGLPTRRLFWQRPGRR
jgi:hypothetical protein